MKKIITVATLLFIAACGKTEVKTLTSKEFKGDYVVNTDFVKENLKNPNVLFVDARGTKAAEKGTLDGAIAVTWQELSNMKGLPGDAGWGTVLPPSELSQKLSDFGLDKNKEIVLFADSKNGWGDDGRILWTLIQAGYNKAKMLDGGIEAINTAKLPKTKTVAPFTPTEIKIDKLDKRNSIDTEELVARIKENPNIKIIDTRTKSEYDGATKYGEKKGGHIKGAILIDFQELYSNGKFKSNDEIVKLLADKGINPDDEIVAYCTAGIRSGLMQLILTMSGFKNVKNYDESFYRWSAVYDVEKN